MTQRVLIYKKFERFWHWMQAILVVMLALTGFEIHFGWWELFGWQAAVELHRIFAWAFVILIAFAIFWHLTTGEWKQYLPTRDGLGAMMRYYLSDIFRGKAHPVKKTQLRKLNPLQAITYLALKVLVIPVLVTSGFLYYYFNEWTLIGLDGWKLEPVALVHTLAAFLMMAFMFMHIYLTTTGHTPLSNIKAMLTGWEELEADDAVATPEKAAPKPA
jgi:thiosulfate reductase cytochrome b subunit